MSERPKTFPSNAAMGAVSRSGHDAAAPFGNTLDSLYAMKKVVNPKSRAARRRQPAATISAEEVAELEVLEERVRSGKETLVSGEAMLRETLKDLRKTRRA